MGLNISFLEVDDECAAGIGLCHNEREEWYSKDRDERHKICKECPLECESKYWHERGIYGCYPRMGSYGYVAGLNDYCEQQDILLDNKFVRLTAGGGFDVVEKDDLPAMLDAVKECREILAGRMIDAGVPYKDGEPTDQIRIASHAINSIGAIDTFCSLGMPERCQVGVHFGRGICKIKGLPNSFGMQDVEYFRETKDEMVLRAFTSFSDRENPPDYVKFEKIPCTQFDHLFDTFERVGRIALEHSLTVQGC